MTNQFNNSILYCREGRVVVFEPFPGREPVKFTVATAVPRGLSEGQEDRKDKRNPSQDSKRYKLIPALGDFKT